MRGRQRVDATGRGGAERALGARRVSTGGPRPRIGHTMTTVGDRIVLFGGLGLDNALYGDTWAWDGSTWSNVATTGVPLRCNHSAAALGGKLWIFGGTGASGDDLNDLWSWDGALWTNVPADDSTPLARHSGAMATLGGDVVLFGGEEDEAAEDGFTHEWSGSAWSLGYSGPALRAECAMAAR